MNGQPFRLTRAQVREVDRLAIEEYHIPGIVLMENASRAATDVIWDEMLMTGERDVLILCGGGNNGGDGLAVARHLHNRGARPRIGLTIDPAKYDGDALTNWRIVEAMDIPRGPATPDTIRADAVGFVVDAIFGTGLTCPPRPPFAEIARAIWETAAHTIAIDLPSGLDCDTGERLREEWVRAQLTVTFVAEKAGFSNPASRMYTGVVTVGDIGCPRELIARVIAGEEQAQ
jgi:NAD(P)H-hydrate epimerase